MAVEEPQPNCEEGHQNEGGGDEELTSLAWLQDTNLLKDFRMGAYEGEDNTRDTDCVDEGSVEDVVVATGNAEQDMCEECEQNVEPNAAEHCPYDPAVHSHSKPPFSFSCLIFMAIEASPRKALPVKDIYGWILDKFPYFQGAPAGWKNSVRHNLSLSKCFRKVEKQKGLNCGKGSLWCIDAEFRPNLLQALQKAPSMANIEFSHFSTTLQNGSPDSEIKPCLLVSSQEAIQIPSPDPEVDAAATMLTLKNGPAHAMHNGSDESENESLQINSKFSRKRLRLKQHPWPHKRTRVHTPSRPIITSSPSEDHTYSACSASDQQQQLPLVAPTHDAEEGAHALMNLAEIASKRLLRKSIHQRRS
ncbi:hypothetical protein JTE90_015929 [Oedothorax gibbosus]|uniref:Fork-head domain-containing protein n=1 Tax=Oedothorax gibbosus TaxID=931172 RepID=A0AAV6TZ57_9ARAC|nr:hypothetical protein JTE90_015929 [Oedothorax gibbosus]